jgi:hypothetical protein
MSKVEHDMDNEGTPIEAPATLPPELWMLWRGEGWVVSLDDAPGGETYLVATSEREARIAAEYQNDMYELNCIPVRVK